MASATSPAPLVLTRRGRRVVAILALLPIVAVFWLMGMRNAQASDTTTPRPTMQTITVKSGQTLWSIAKSIAPDTDPRETIYNIEQINGLKTSAVEAGSQIIVPVVTVPSK